MGFTSVRGSFLLYNLSRKVGIKIAGGVKTTADAIKYYTLVKELLGEEWLDPNWFRIGASKLANHLLSDIKGETVNYF